MSAKVTCGCGVGQACAREDCSGTPRPLPPPQARTPLDLIEWLRNEAKTRIQDAKSRRPSPEIRNMTVAELKQSKKMAEKFSGRKLDLVSTSVKDNLAQCDMQDRIAGKLEKEAAQLNEWADSLTTKKFVSENRVQGEPATGQFIHPPEHSDTIQSGAESAPQEAGARDVEPQPNPNYCFECDDIARCASAETCYGHHEGYPKLRAERGVPLEEKNG